MKAICLWQPWATLVAIGAKRVETRGWKTNYTGELAIVATALTPPFARDLACSGIFASALKAGGVGPTPLPTGCVVGVVELHAYLTTESCREQIDDRERAFGDYSPGRYGWLLRNARALPHPLPCKGRQGMFLLPRDVEDAVRAGLAISARREGAIA